jgi:putative oxidoreductase
VSALGKSDGITHSANSAGDGWRARRILPTLEQAILLLRGTVALIFMAHALVRLVNGSAPQFGAFLEARGYPWGFALVLMISAYEILGGLLLALGIRVKLVCAGLAFIVLMGIVIIHRHFGWFVGEHGTGGMEFSWLLVAALLMLAANDNADRRVSTDPSSMTGQAGAANAMLDPTPPR